MWTPHFQLKLNGHWCSAAPEHVCFSKHYSRGWHAYSWFSWQNTISLSPQSCPYIVYIPTLLNPQPTRPDTRRILKLLHAHSLKYLHHNQSREASLSMSLHQHGSIGFQGPVRSTTLLVSQQITLVLYSTWGPTSIAVALATIHVTVFGRLGRQDITQEAACE